MQASVPAPPCRPEPERPEVQSESRNSSASCARAEQPAHSYGQCPGRVAGWLFRERWAQRVAAEAAKPIGDGSFGSLACEQGMQGCSQHPRCLQSQSCVLRESETERWRQSRLFSTRRFATAYIRLLSREQEPLLHRRNAETALALAFSRSEPAQPRRRRRCPPDRRCKNAVTAASHARRDTSRDPGADR